MKKIIVVMASIIIPLTACADHEYLVEFADLPISAQNFIQKYYNANDIVYVECEHEGMRHEYNVRMRDATEIEFDLHGTLESIDSKMSPLPPGIVPKVVVDYLKLHYAGRYVVKYAIDYRNIEIELDNDLELLFDLEGNFLRMDD